MDYKIKKMAGFKVIGFSRDFDGERAYVEIPKFWDEIREKYAARVWIGAEPANAHEKAIVDNNIEWYGDGDPSASDYHAAIWIPVKKK